jgi:MFS transporter, FHS family, L-fucose permease
MKRNYYLVGLVFLTFFVISFLTNILGPLIPDIVTSFNLSLTMVAFLPFSFFVAYGVMSIPAGMMLERLGEKAVMLIAFAIAFFGAGMLAVFPSYLMAILSLFSIGIGMAVLQVAINPLLRVSGGEEHFAFNSVMAQLVFGSASFMSPLVYSYLVLNIQNGSTAGGGFFLSVLSSLVPQNLAWISLYWLFTAVILAMILVVAFSRFPKVRRKEEEKTGGWHNYRQLFKNPVILLYFLGIFAYVGSEQGVANWMSQFLYTYHGYDPQVVGARTVSLFWGLMTLGCLLGLVLLKFIDSRKVICIFVVGAVTSLTIALFASGPVALVAFPMVGFFASVMWSVIFSLALNSVKEFHGAFSGILCTGIVGGAVVPLIVGWLGDIVGLRAAMVFLYLTFAYLFSIGLWARPLIPNKTISLRRKQAALVS